MDDPPQVTDPPAPRTTLPFHFPYRPSNFLCYTLILWTVLCIIGEVIIPWLGAFFALTTYGPTIHFAVQCIIQTNRGSYETADSKKLGRRAATLTVIWVLSITAWVFFWWSERMYPEIFLIPLPPGSQSTVILLYIALRSAWDKRVAQSQGLLGTHTEDAATLDTDAESQSLLTSDPRLKIYRPSKTLLVVSMIIALGSWCTETLYFTWGSQRGDFVAAWAFILLWPYITLFVLQMIVLYRSLGQCESTLSDEGGIGNHAVDSAAIFIALKPLVMMGSIAPPPYRTPLYIPGVVQGCLSVYIAARYMWSFSKVAPYYAQITRPGENSGDTTQLSAPDSPSPSSNTAYNPLFITSLLWLTLSALCIYIEAPKEPAIGLPMAVLVYIPTIVFCMFLLHPREPYVQGSTGHKKAADWALQLACLWVASHLFYLLIWPVSQYLVAKVMDPYIRGAAVALSVYIAIRFSSRKSGSREGAIALSPDADGHQDVEHGVDPADVSNVNTATGDSAQPTHAGSSSHSITSDNRPGNLAGEVQLSSTEQPQPHSSITSVPLAHSAAD